MGPGSPGRATSAPNVGAISPDPTLLLDTFSLVLGSSWPPDSSALFFQVLELQLYIATLRSQLGFSASSCIRTVSAPLFDLIESRGVNPTLPREDGS